MKPAIHTYHVPAAGGLNRQKKHLRTGVPKSTVLVGIDQRQDYATIAGHPVTTLRQLMCGVMNRHADKTTEGSHHAED